MAFLAIGGSNNDGLYRHDKSQIFYFRKYREGKGEIFKSLKTKDLNKARKRRDDLMQELWGDKSLKTKRLTVGELWALWFKGMKETKSPGTANSIASAWKNLEPYAGNLFLDEFTSEWWTNSYIPLKRAEQNPRKAIDNSKRKFFNECKWSSMMLKWCEENGKGDNGWHRPKLLNPDPPRDKGQVYTNEQLSRLKAYHDVRVKILVVMGEQHFMRRSEALLLSWDRVDFSSRTIYLRAQDTKIRKARTFPINEELFELLEGQFQMVRMMGSGSLCVFPSASDPSTPLTFSEFRILWDKAKASAEITGKGKFHWLRHTGLTKACKVKGVDLAGLCVFAGLSIDELMATYVHYTTEDLRGIENLVGAA